MGIRTNDKLWSQVAMSGIRVIMEQVRSMKEQGIEVVGFTAGEPDFNTPEDIKKYTIEAIENNQTHYTSNRGAISLRKAICESLEKKVGIKYDPDTEILITTGGAEAINNAFATSICPGDEVIIFSPAFMNYENMVIEIGAKPILIELNAKNKYQIDLDEVRNAITEKTSHIIINNPCNPTGAVYSEDVLEGLCNIAKENNLTVISDEIYSEITYDNIKFKSIASFTDMKEHCIIINGFSKTYAMTGWRLGYCLAPKNIIDVMVKPHQYSTTSGVTFIQEGTAKGMNTEKTLLELENMKKIFNQRRELICSKLDEIKKLSYVRPQGAFYLLVDVSKTGLDGKEFATRLLEEKRCAVIPAVVLGKECINYIRISFATDDRTIEKGMSLLREFVQEL